MFDGDFIEQIDSVTKKGWSEFYNFRDTKTDGCYGNYKSSGILKPEHFKMMLDMTGDRIIQLSSKMAEGKITAEPYRLGTSCPCIYCDFRNLCRFDWQINDYRFLSTVKKEDVFHEAGGG